MRQPPLIHEECPNCGRPCTCLLLYENKKTDANIETGFFGNSPEYWSRCDCGLLFAYKEHIEWELKFEDDLNDDDKDKLNHARFGASKYKEFM